MVGLVRVLPAPRVHPCTPSRGQEPYGTVTHLLGQQLGLGSAPGKAGHSPPAAVKALLPCGTLGRAGCPLLIAARGQLSSKPRGQPGDNSAPRPLGQPLGPVCAVRPMGRRASSYRFALIWCRPHRLGAEGCSSGVRDTEHPSPAPPGSVTPTPCGSLQLPAEVWRGRSSRQEEKVACSAPRLPWARAHLISLRGTRSCLPHGTLRIPSRGSLRFFARCS